MRSKLILFLLLLLIEGLSLNAKVKYTPFKGNTSQDSDRNEFNLKKKNIKVLVKDKRFGSVLRYYAFYLKENDHKRADSLVDHMITSKSDVGSRLKISLIAYQYTSDTKTRLLFLSDPDQLQTYQISLMKYSKDSLKSNADTRAYYYNLVSLDAAVYERTQDSVVRKQLSRHYNSLAWFSILTQKLDGVEHYLHQSIKYDPLFKYPYSNLPLLLLLKGRYKEAHAFYVKYKDLPLDTPNITYRDGFLEDFDELAKVGIKHRDIAKIIKVLNAPK